MSAGGGGCCLCGLVAAGGPFAGAAEAFAGLIAFLAGPGAAGMEAQEAEQFLRTAVREAGRRALQGFFDQRAGREQRLAAVTGSDQVTRRRAKRNRARTLGTGFGDVRVARIAYRRRGAADLHPADGQLNLPPTRESWPLQKLTVIHAAKGSYQDAARAVGGPPAREPRAAQASSALVRVCRISQPMSHPPTMSSGQ